MKPNSETKLLVFLALFVGLGGGFLWFTNRKEEPKPPPSSAEVKSLFERVSTDAAHARGPADAPITLLEFADFECPNCRKAYERSFSRLEKRKDVRVIFRHLPLPKIHQTAMPAAIAAEAAANQGKFWEMYDALFDPKAKPLDAAFLKASAKKIGLDVAKFEKDIADPATKAKVEADMKVADSQKIDTTPTVFLKEANGTVTMVTGALQMEQMLQAKGIQEALPMPADAQGGPPIQ